jgi:hypothetical protein
MFKKYKKMIIILGIIVIAAIAYTLMIGNTDDSLLVSEGPVSGSGDSELQNELLALLLEIRSIKLDESILSDPVFISLEDFGQEIIPEPVGRENPFAPVKASELGVLPTEDQGIE